MPFLAVAISPRRPVAFSPAMVGEMAVAFSFWMVGGIMVVAFSPGVVGVTVAAAFSPGMVVEAGTLAIALTWAASPSGKKQFYITMFRINHLHSNLHSKIDLKELYRKPYSESKR